MSNPGIYGFSAADLPLARQPEPRTRGGARYWDCVSNGAYSLMRIELAAGASEALHYFQHRRGSYLVEVGEVVLARLRPDGEAEFHVGGAGAVAQVASGELHGFHANVGSVLFFFGSGTDEDDVRWAGPLGAAAEYPVPAAAARMRERCSDVREKYWGTIATVCSEEFAGKRITVRRGGQSSLEFHCHKQETYYLESGRLRTGWRVGRGVNCSSELEAGQALEIQPGMMHMRIGLEDSVIMEISTRDNDADSHLVEDGQFYVHRETLASRQHPSNPICL